MAFIVGFLLQLFVIYCPGLNTVVFKFVALSLPQLLISIALALVIVVIMEVSKLLQKNNK
jgi:hypothetical protein